MVVHVGVDVDVGVEVWDEDQGCGYEYRWVVGVRAIVDVRVNGYGCGYGRR